MATESTSETRYDPPIERDLGNNPGPVKFVTLAEFDQWIAAEKEFWSTIDNGLTYATLTMSRDPSERKMLAVGALMDRRMYGLVADAPADEPTIPGC